MGGKNHGREGWLYCKFMVVVTLQIIVFTRPATSLANTFHVNCYSTYVDLLGNSPPIYLFRDQLFRGNELREK